MATSTRELRDRQDREHGRADWSGDDLGTMFLMLWVVSVVQVVHTMSHHEAFGTIPTLALVCIVFLPALIWRELMH
jgi:hypothetical protein